MLRSISVSQMLSEVHATTPDSKPFMLIFVISRGKRRGVKKTVARALKGHSPDTHGSSGTGTRGKFLYKEHDALPIIDLDNGNQLLTPLISHIIQYNSCRVVH